MTIGGRALRAGDGDNRIQKVAEKFRSVIGMDNIWRAATKVELIKQTRYEDESFAIRERDENHSFCEAIYESQGLGLAGSCKTLALEVHSIARARFRSRVG